LSPEFEFKSETRKWEFELKRIKYLSQEQLQKVHKKHKDIFNKTSSNSSDKNNCTIKSTE